jgi:hypothetical protein
MSYVPLIYPGVAARISIIPSHTPAYQLSPAIFPPLQQNVTFILALSLFPHLRSLSVIDIGREVVSDIGSVGEHTLST